MANHRQPLIERLTNKLSGIVSNGVEVGIYKGRTSLALLTAFPLLKLVMVDPWKAWKAGTSYHDKHKSGKHTQLEFDKVYEEAMNSIAFVKDRAEVLKTVSVNAASYLNSRTFPYLADFIFIDADHTYEHVKEDISIWLPFVKKGGIFCGHDYNRRHRGVMKAVNEFAADKGFEVGTAPGNLWWVQIPV